MAVLAEQMREKTNDYVNTLGKKLAPHVPNLPGEFLLNIKDKEGPLFTEVTPVRVRAARNALGGEPLNAAVARTSDLEKL